MDFFPTKRSAKFFSLRLGKQLAETTTTSDQTAGDHPVTALSQGPKPQPETKMPDTSRSADSELDTTTEVQEVNE